MSQISKLSSIQSSLSSLSSLMTSVNRENEKRSSSQADSPLFNFLRLASTSGLRQYNQDIVEEGLIAARLGEGAEYVVDKVKTHGGEVVVVKHVKVTMDLASTMGTMAGQDASRLRKVLHEVRIATMPLLKNHANILQMKGFGWELSESSLTTPFLVVEYAENGTMRDFLQQSTGVTFSSKIELCLDIAKGLQALHSSKIAHGDLKLENVLVCQKPAGPLGKLSDFGLSIFIDDERKSFEYWGTEQYRPPEVWEQVGGSASAGLIQGAKLRACDIYALGLVLWETLLDGKNYFRQQGLLSGRALAQDEIQNHALHWLSSLEDIPPNMKMQLHETLAKSLDLSPDARPQIDAVVSSLRRESLEDNVLSDIPFIDSLSLEDDSYQHSQNEDFRSFNQLFATLVGRELEDGSTHIAPWVVQTTVTTGLLHLAASSKPQIAAKASLELAACYYLGFGVERDLTKVLQYMDKAAAKGSFEAFRLRRRLYEAFAEPMESLALEIELEGSDEAQLRNIDDVEARGEVINPFRVFDDVSQISTREALEHSSPDLHSAAYLGDIEQLQFLLRGVMDHQDDAGRSALFLACQGGHLDAMELLLQHGSSPSIADEDGHTPLHMLIMFSYTEVDAALSLLLKYFPTLDLNPFSDSVLDASEHWCELWGAPLHWGVLAGNEAMVRTLVKHGARVQDWPQDSCPIRIATSLHLSTILEVLVNTMSPTASLIGENPFFALNASNPLRRLLIHGKNYSREIEYTVAVLARKWSVLEGNKDELHGTPLRKILLLNMSDADQYIAKSLINIGAYTALQDRLTLLQASIIGCRGSPLPSICRMALNMIDIPQDYFQCSTEYRLGWNALHWAVAGGIVPVAEKLLRVAPTLINTRVEDDDEGATALHLAAESARNIEMIKLLLSHGADAVATTHKLRLTPLGSFLSNQRSELNHNILEVLLTASEPAGYLVFSSSDWNVLHYAVGRAAMLDAESLGGHILLRDLLTFKEIRDLVESTTVEGWTPLHLACYFVDYAAIRILVDDFSADVSASTPNGARSFDIVLERARRYPDGLRGADSMSRWTRSAFRSALFLQEKLEAIEGSFELPRLHIAAYIGHFDEVVTLVGQDLNAIAETNYDGETALEMLEHTLPTAVPEGWASRFCKMAERVIEFLQNKELELEEERYFAQRNITTIKS